MYCAALCALIVGFINIAGATVEHSPVDALRARFYIIEEQLWKNVTDIGWNEHTEVGADVELTKQFKRLNEDIRSLPKMKKPELGHLWLWNKAWEKVRKIEGMYKEFLEFSETQAMPGSVPAPVKKWLDLAEHVLMDPELSVVNAVNKLSDLMEHGDLFRVALQVFNKHKNESYYYD